MFSVQGLIITFMFGYLMAIVIEGIRDIINHPDAQALVKDISTAFKESRIRKWNM